MLTLRVSNYEDSEVILLNDLLTSADVADDFDPSLHHRILDFLNQTPPQSLSLRDRFRAADYLQRSILYIAHKHDYSVEKIHRNRAGEPVANKLVDEGKFPEEMNRLMGLADTLHYSPNLREWLEERQKILVSAMTEDPEFMRGLQSWGERTAAERLDVLQDAVRRIFAAHDLSRVPVVAADDTIEDYAAKTVTGGETQGAASEIRISPQFLEDKICLLPLVLTYHETIHAIIADMALSVAQCAINPAHPLYGDAALSLEKERHGMPPIPLLETYYNDDDEEKLAYACQNAFGYALIDARKPAP